MAERKLIDGVAIWGSVLTWESGRIPGGIPDCPFAPLAAVVPPLTDDRWEMVPEVIGGMIVYGARPKLTATSK